MANRTRSRRGLFARPNDGRLQLSVDDGDPCLVFPLELVVAGQLAIGQWDKRLRRARRVQSENLRSRWQVDRPASVYDGVPKVDTAVLLVNILYARSPLSGGFLRNQQP